MLATPEFKAWHKLEVAKRTGAYAAMVQRVENAVDEQLKDKYLKIETYEVEDSSD